jgi:hypothetical protein
MAEEKPTDTPAPEPILASSKDQLRMRTERFRTAYTNNVALTFSTFDVSFLFGEIIGEKDGEPVIEEFLKINMSRELAKAITILLRRHLSAWEKQFGEIRIPNLDAAALLTEMVATKPE